MRKIPYIIKNILLNRLRFQFPEKNMERFFNALPYSDCIGDKNLELRDKIAIMTFDDEFDREIHDYEKAINAKSTFFLLSYHLDGMAAEYDHDVQLHFDKRYSSITNQIKRFKKFTKRNPIANRNHTLWWKHNHHDLLYLALHGIKVDSSLTGTEPFRLCVQGKLLPIWEVPFNVCDSSSVLSAPYSIAKSMGKLFSSKVTPIVGLFHPHLKNKSNWKEFYKCAKKYNYRLMSISEFYREYLEGE